jgi:hypothetical protein
VVEWIVTIRIIPDSWNQLFEYFKNLNSKIKTLWYSTWSWCRLNVQCTWRAIYVQAVLLRIVQWGSNYVVAHNGGWPSFWLIWMHACILTQTGSAKWENKPIPRLQFRAANSLDFMSSQLHVRHSK